MAHPSEEPLNTVNLDAIAYDCTHGDCSGKVTLKSSDAIDGKEAAEALEAQASSPSSFRLTEEGEDVE